MATTRQVLLQARLALVRRDLAPILDRLTPDLLEWAPTPGMRTVGGQLIEIVVTEIQLVTLLRDDHSLSDEEAQALIGDWENLDNLCRAIGDTRRQTLEYLESLSEADLSEEIVFTGGWFGSLDLPTVPRAEVFVNIADHEWYHVGQLTAYLWARGSNPYHWW